jgi:hypothetical protein
MTDDHDPTGHVWLSSSVLWECHLCGKSVEMAEWETRDGKLIVRWKHSEEPK